MTIRRIPLLLIMLAACEKWPAPSPMTREQHEADYAQWREGRRTGLVRPGSGALTWIGLWELPKGTFTVGSADSSYILFRDDRMPKKLGTIVRNDSGITFTPQRG